MRHATGTETLARPATRLMGGVLTLVEGVAFWAATTFPLVHAAAIALYARDALQGSALAALLALNAVAIVAGHRHRRTEGRRG